MELRCVAAVLLHSHVLEPVYSCPQAKEKLLTVFLAPVGSTQANTAVLIVEDSVISSKLAIRKLQALG